MYMKTSRLYHPRRSCRPFIIGLVLAGTFLLYHILMCQALLRQNVIAIGAFQEQSAAASGGCAAFLNLLFAGASSDALYQQGLLALKDSGYGGSFPRLFLAPYANLSLLFAGIFLFLAAGMILSQWIVRNRVIRDTRTVLAWMESDAKTVPSTRSFPEALLLSAARMRESIVKQQLLHEEDDTRILHYMEDISHQLKTPLSVIRVICEKMLLRFPEHEKPMEQCLAQIDRMHDMIRNLIQLGKFDCHLFKMHFVPVFAKQLVETVSNDISVMAQSKGIDIAVTGSDHIQWFCDAFWMQEVIGNILKNCVEQSSDGVITLHYEQDRGNNRIIIKDCGNGFTDGREHKIFDRYFLGDRTKEGGTGLGLAIARQIIRLHFGTVTAANRKEGGAQFIISFPQLDAAAIYHRTD